MPSNDAREEHSPNVLSKVVTLLVSQLLKFKEVKELFQNIPEISVTLRVSQLLKSKEVNA